GEHGTEARDVLASAGLDRDQIRAALDREFRQSLAAAGVTLPPGGLPAASRDPERRARLAASGKLVLERALKAAAGQRQIPPRPPAACRARRAGGPRAPGAGAGRRALRRPGRPDQAGT